MDGGVNGGLLIDVNVSNPPASSAPIPPIIRGIRMLVISLL